MKSESGLDLDSLPDIPTYDKALQLDGDVGGGIVIVGDLHSPAINWTMVERVAAVAKKWLKRPRRLVVAGDTLNCDSFSPFTPLLPQPAFGAERQAAQQAFGFWLDTFNEIYVLPGNHDVRLLKKLEGALDEATATDMFAALISTSPRVRYSIYPYLNISCARTGRWLVVHPQEYSQILLSKARKFATRYQSHVILPHQHYAALGIHESGEYAVIDLPGLFDVTQMQYVALGTRTNPAMQTGFGALFNGSFQLFTENASVTNWRHWLGAKYDTATGE